VHDYCLYEELDRDHFYNSIEEALDDIDSEAGSAAAGEASQS
jgi:hypothetical protein